MKKSDSKIRNKLFNSIFFLAIICLTSCENFLDNENIKDEILSTIEYNNAAECTVLIKTQKDLGEFYPEGEKTFKVGYGSEVQFTVNKEKYSFRKLEAVSKSNPDKSLSDYVSFTPLDSDDKKGLYKFDVKILKSSSDLLIRPDCYLLPAVSSTYPVRDNTSYPQDTSIKIFFNKAVNLNDFKDSDGFLKNISIKNEETDLLDTQYGKSPFYKDPYLMDGGKTLVIPIVTGNYLVKENQTKDITVTLNLNGIKDAVEGEHALFPQTSYTFSFTVNSEKDSSLPELKTLNIARTREDAINGTNLISIDEFTHYAAKANYNGDSSQVAANIHNHHVNKVWVYFEAEDSDSGAAYLEVKEQIIRDTSGNEQQGAIYNKSNTASNCIKNTSDNNNYSGCFEYDFKSYTDGVARLQFDLFDYSGNAVTKAVDLVKDTVCDYDFRVYITNPEKVNTNDGSKIFSYKVSINTYLDYNETGYIKDLDDIEYLDTQYSDSENDFSNCIKISSLEYGIDENNMSSVNLSNSQYWIIDYDSEKSKYFKEINNVSISINPYKEHIIKINVEDNIGNINTITHKTTVMPDVIGYSISKNNGNTVIKPILSCYPDNISYEIYAEGNTDKIATTSTYTYSDSEYASQPESLYFLAQSREGRKGASEPFYFISGYGDTCVLRKTNGSWTFGEASQNQLSESDIPAFNVRISEAKPDSTGTRTVYVDYNKNFTFNPAYSYYVNVDGVYHSENELTLKSRSEPYSISVVVVNKNGQSVESNVRSIDLSYDNIAPEIFLYPSNFVNGELIMTTTSLIKDEGGSGLKMYKGKPFVQYLILTDSSKLPASINEWKANPNVKTASFVREYDDDYNTHRMDYKMEYYDSFPQIIVWFTEDNNGNGVIETRNISYYRRAVITKINYGLKNIEYKNNKFFETYNTQTSKIDQNHYFISNGEWKVISSNEKNNYPLSDQNGESTSFIRITQIYSVISINFPIYYINNIPYYYYPPYIKARDTDNPMVCDLKDLYIGQAGINILADQPCFVHTMYCPNKLENTPEAWLNGGIETGLVMKQKSFTYSYDNLSGVPDGYYYTTIVHFADGTMLMTDVKKM